ncbi:glycosyltransferase family 4 protein [Solidesulfovibrio sp.]|uniref:glycosyltransferase family 4 protein n=1 Tax=Solidesulfovibrio sp. TaxID=2910990 RepID=UPI00261DE6DF|nr:glycosyltransferase family 4 protein [Solidesulfovibrio sp.]
MMATASDNPVPRRLSREGEAGVLPEVDGLRLAHLILDMGFGGAERLAQDVAIALQERGARCHVVCFDAISGNTAPLARHGIPVELIQRKQIAFDSRACLRLLRRLKALGVQLLHAHDLSSLSYAVAAGLLLGIPVVMTEHSRHYIEARRIRRLEKRLLCLGVRRLVAVSPELARASVERDHVAPGKVAVIENGVDVERYARAQGRAFREELALGPGEALVGMVGRLEAIKGPDVLLEAFTALAGRFPGARLAYVGEGGLGEALRARSQALGLAARVRFLGSRSDIPQVMSGLDILVLPSLSEGLPLALLEGMAAGRAVVATAVGRVPGIVRPAWEGENGRLVPPGDVRALARTLMTLLGDAPLRARLGRAAQDFVARRYRLQDTFRNYQTVYAQALAGRT